MQTFFRKNCFFYLTIGESTAILQKTQNIRKGLCFMSYRKLAVCGCSLVDHLYPNISFGSPVFQKYVSRKNGDGGIAVGKLVFAEDLEAFAGTDFDTIEKEVAGSSELRNIGGPAIVGAINVAQILYRNPELVSFYGVSGTDENGEFLRNMIAKTDVDTKKCRIMPGATPCTCVLSDPDYHGGKGERSFINRIGSASQMTPADLDEDFFAADVLWFSATALVPELHDNLASLLRKGKDAGKINVVSTVFDFRNEKKDPSAPWPLGDYRDIDLLIVDFDEALRLSGTADIESAFDFFKESGVSAFFITHGAKIFHAWSDGRLFESSHGKVYDLPVSALADQDMAEHPERKGDTTGCGDNFAGGVTASLFLQSEAGKMPGNFSLLEAAAWGAASGGAACFQVGGTMFEKERGEKYAVLERYALDYIQNVKPE